MSDPLGDWWGHVLTVERFTGDSAYGDQFDAPAQITGFYSDKAVYNGGQIVAQGRFAFPRSTTPIPLQSRVTLPADVFGTLPDGSPRVYRVTSTAVGDGVGQPTPDHQMVEVN